MVSHWKGEYLAVQTREGENCGAGCSGAVVSCLDMTRVRFNYVILATRFISLAFSLRPSAGTSILDTLPLLLLGVK